MAGLVPDARGRIGPKERVIEGLLLHKRQDAGRPKFIIDAKAHRKRLLRRLVGVDGHAELLEVVHARGSTRGLSCRLHSRQQQANQRRDDRDHDQQFHEREAASARDVRVVPHEPSLRLGRTRRLSLRPPWQRHESFTIPRSWAYDSPEARRWSPCTAMG